MINLSRSYKKNPYYRLVCQRDTTISKVKRMSNRKIRRKMKQGLLDYELTCGPSSYKKIEDWAWEYDIFTLYGGNRDEWDDPEDYDRACVRK